MDKRRKAATKKRAPRRASKRAATKKKASKKTAKKTKTARKVQAKKTATKRKAPAKKAATKRKAPAKKTATKAADNVVEIRRYTELSISQVSLDTGMTRKTISKRIAEAGLTAARLERGYPVYRLRDLLAALFTETDGVTDPDKLRPFERRAFYQGEQDKLKLQQDRGELVPSFEVERTFALLFKTLTQRLDILPDELEREVGLSGGALALVEKTIDELREALYAQVTRGELDANSADEKRA